MLALNRILSSAATAANYDDDAIDWPLSKNVPDI